MWLFFSSSDTDGLFVVALVHELCDVGIFLGGNGNFFREFDGNVNENEVWGRHSEGPPFRRIETKLGLQVGLA